MMMMTFRLTSMIGGRMTRGDDEPYDKSNSAAMGRSSRGKYIDFLCAIFITNALKEISLILKMNVKVTERKIRNDDGKYQKPVKDITYLR